MATMEDRETSSLIGSDKVEGTNVYGADGEKVGYIERVMIDKVSGKVSYAVLSFGGLLGIGDDHYPLPWQTLKYDTNLGGYVVTGISQDQLRGAPKYADESSWNWSDPATTRSVNAYYGVPVVDTACYAAWLADAGGRSSAGVRTCALPHARRPGSVAEEI